jgi:hypothetical protein
MVWTEESELATATETTRALLGIKSKEQPYANKIHLL